MFPVHKEPYYTDTKFDSLVFLHFLFHINGQALSAIFNLVTLFFISYIEFL